MRARDWTPASGVRPVRTVGIFGLAVFAGRSDFSDGAWRRLVFHGAGVSHERADRPIALRPRASVVLLQALNFQAVEAVKDVDHSHVAKHEVDVLRRFFH